MSTESTGTDPRARLVDAAVRLLADNGPEALQARKVATEIGASTMAVYTHFGGMGELLEAVAREGFRRLTASLDLVPKTADAVADIFTMGFAYRETALENPHLYAVTFGLSGPGGRRVAMLDMTSPPEEGAAHQGLDAFAFLLDATARAIDAGRFTGVEPLAAAAQLWSALHGYVTLEISGHFGPAGLDFVLLPLSVTIVRGLGDTIEASKRSLRASTDSWRKTEGNAGAHSGD